MNRINFHFLRLVNLTEWRWPKPVVICIIFLVIFNMLRFVVVNFSWFVGCICFNHLLQVDDLVGSRPSELNWLNLALEMHKVKSKDIVLQSYYEKNLDQTKYVCIQLTFNNTLHYYINFCIIIIWVKCRTHQHKVHIVKKYCYSDPMHFTYLEVLYLLNKTEA